MADITMCSGKNCPLSNTCYRFKAIACEYRQGYFVEPPYNKELNECEHYWITKF